MTETDIFIVGAGPIGIELAVAIHQAGADYVHVEAGPIGNTIWRWPRMTRFFSNPEVISIAGVPLERLGQDRPFGEEYLAYLRTVVRHYRLPIRTHERVEHIEPQADGFRLETTTLTGRREYRARRVVLATGDMAHPRRLGIAGEDLPHVRHGLDDPHEFFGRRVLIVGGRNSAVEAAMRCFRAGADVTLSYRGAALDTGRISHKLGPVVEEMIEQGKIAFRPATVPVEIRPGEVLMAHTDAAGQPTTTTAESCLADFVLILVGYEADVTLFEQAGAAFAGPQHPPGYDPATMETTVSGLYVAGTASAGREPGHSMFIETSHVHVARIVRAFGLPCSEWLIPWE